MPIRPLKRKRTPASHWIVALTLLLLPMAVGLFFYLPRYYSFTAPGDIVSVRDIGVKGSVHFVYVREGIARNRYEKYALVRSFPDAEFTRVDASAEDAYGDLLDVEQDMKNDTIKHAVDSAAELSAKPSTPDQRESRLQSLIGQTAQYYGDSIGLMLGIGLYEESHGLDFSRDGQYTIAGTGTLEADRTVGSVGAIRDKLRTAEAEGADFFFVPKDEANFPYIGPSNEEEARRTAEELHLRLHVVPVSTLQEALACLKTIP
ncbi:hypothetical protein [Paenibacillus sp. UNC496MF]|uniref:hypothetical protein n=1 Tax=Paenibacillus sp. UNC496MF TaxID=1502753 RepID=UPI0011604FAB|nr:hypothetical protein [Paenibacillus sp. UNC496MF]